MNALGNTANGSRTINATFGACLPPHQFAETHLADPDAMTPLFLMDLG